MARTRRSIADTSWCQGSRSVRSTVVWRGLARSSYSNMSSLVRLSADYRQLERHLIRNFRKYAHREAPGPTTWDWLSLAQHHGLPTRLLDWTFSPLVALHFATAHWPDDEAVLLGVDCEGAHEGLPAALHGLYEREGSLVFTTEMLAELAPDLEGFDALTESEPFVVFFEPPSFDERIVNQAAVCRRSRIRPATWRTGWTSTPSCGARGGSRRRSRPRSATGSTRRTSTSGY